jgi:hypothetical protein
MTLEKPSYLSWQIKKEEQSQESAIDEVKETSKKY